LKIAGCRLDVDGLGLGDLLDTDAHARAWFRKFMLPPPLELHWVR